MSGAIVAVPVSEITSGQQLFRCVPYSCTMLARACVERQAKAELGLDALALLHCKGCELGAEVQARAAGVVIDESSLLRGARASGHHRGGAIGERLRAARNNPAPPVPAAVVDAERSPAAPALPPALTTAPTVASPKTEETMSGLRDLAGKEMCGVRVLQRSPIAISNGSAVWRVKHLACGHEQDISTPSLDYTVKHGGTRRCPQCSTVGSPTPRATAHRKPKTKVEPVKASAPAPIRPAKRPSVPLPTELGVARVHEFPLRRDFTANVSLPYDLSKLDVQRLGRWLEALVFEE